MNGQELLEQGLVQLGLEPDGLAERLWAYFELVNRENDRFGLVKFDNEVEFVCKHLLDSLAPWRLLEPLAGSKSAWLDLGSGAGLPGIPLALAFPNTRLTLAERKGKRATFLQQAITELALANVQLWPQPFEELKARFPVAVFRAFSPLEPDLIKLLKKVLIPGGIALAYKGRRTVVETELNAVSGLVQNAELVRLQVPFLNEERHAVLLRFAGKNPSS